MSSSKCALGLAVLALLLLTACEGPSPLESPPSDTPLTTVDAVLARACELAADCVDATQEDIQACPGNLLAKLDADDIAELEQITLLGKAEQDRILECFDSMICGRFGGSLASISDSDLMEPMRSCREQ